MILLTPTTAQPILKWLRLILYACVAVASVSLAVLLWPKPSHLPNLGSAPAFQFTNQANKTISDADLRGKVSLVSFIYTHCPDVCPLITTQMKSLQVAIKSQGMSDDVTLVSISVDPERDTPAVLADYAAKYGADTAAWHFLTGEPSQVRKVVVDGFYAGFEQTGQAGHDHSSHDHGAATYEVTHSTRVALIDKDGRIRAYYDSSMEWDPEKILADISSLR